MKKKSKAADLLWTIVPMVLVIPLCIWALFQMDKASYDCFFVVGPSMQPTLCGDSDNSTYGYSDNSDYAIDNLERFDLVICYYPFASSPDYISHPYIPGVTARSQDATLKVKRVIGLPGDTLEIDNEVFSIKYTVNGKEIVETYGGDNLKVPFERKTPIESRKANITLSEGQYFVMGDNWTKSGSCDCCNPSLGGTPEPIYRQNIDGVIIRLEGTCTYGSCKHCTSCKKIVEEDAFKCKCGGTKFRNYDDILEERPYKDGPIYLK